MSFLISNKGAQSKSRSKSLFTSSAATVLASFAFMGTAQTANAQVVDVATCADLPLSNPGSGATVNVLAGVGTCVVGSGDHIELEDDAQDNVTINVASGVTLTNADSSDEDVVIFIDNSENNTTINIEQGASLRGENGVIFAEGDRTIIRNSGDIIGFGTAEEGVIYIDRDTDSDVNRIVNNATGRIIAQDNGPAIGIETLIADGADDQVDIGNQDPISDFPTIRIINRAGGVIRAVGSSSDDNDAINVAGNRGDTGGFTRECVEGATVNCHVNLALFNFGTIESDFDNSGVAGITFEDDAIFNGIIANRASGVITGTRNGIRIGDVEALGGNAPEHTGRIFNGGSITGTGASSRGIDLEGDGVEVTNTATGTISGVSIGIEVGAGDNSSQYASGTRVDNSGLNNRIINYGTISGGNQSIDSSNAEGDINIVSNGGVFDGDIRGSVANLDILRILGGTTDLTHDVLNNFSVRVNPTGTLNFVGDREIQGDVHGRGTFGFDIGDTQTVTGDLNLRPNSTVALTDAGSIGAVGQSYTLVSVGGTLTNEAVLDDSDASLLLDYDFDTTATDLVVTAVASGSGTPNAKVSGYVADIDFASAETQSFGKSVLTAFVDGGLNNTSAFSNLASLGDSESLGLTLESLAPDFSGSLTQNIYNSVQNGAAQVEQRMNDLDCKQFYDGRETSSLNVSGTQACQSFAQTGSWVQVASPYASQGSLSLSSPTYLNSGNDSESVTMTYGYDQAVDNDTIFGLSGSYTRTEADNDALSVSQTDFDIMQFSAYAGHRLGNLNLVTKASYAAGEAETRRQSFDIIKADVGFRGLNVQSVASYDVELGKGLYLKPEAGFLYDNVTTSAYTEAGGLNLDVDGTSSNVVDARMGLTLGARRVLSDSLRADAYVTGAVIDDVYGQRDNIGYSFGGQSGVLASRSLDNFAVQGLMGLNLLSSENFSFGAALSSEFSDTETAVGTSVKTKLRW